MSEQKPADEQAIVEEDLAGVQGEDPSEAETDAVGETATPGAPADAPAPDAGEIEWAGAVVKKPPEAIG